MSIEAALRSVVVLEVQWRFAPRSEPDLICTAKRRYLLAPNTIYETWPGE